VLDGDECLKTRPSRVMLGKENFHLLNRRHCGPEQFWALWRRKQSVAHVGTRTPDRPARSLTPYLI